ncbi:MAG: hypothetical protein IJ179_09650 [Oscillospiraceae bacterium]|nr:hypothetical protein [Oscillospiraceae bacterium]
MSHLYDDIINMPHHVSDKHPQMPMIDRAAQFSPFAALTGYDAAIVETARLTEEKRELSEEQKQVINKQLGELQSRLKTDPVATVVFFRADSRKAGGSYETITGAAKKVDDYLGILEMANGVVIPFDDIMSLE